LNIRWRVSSIWEITVINRCTNMRAGKNGLPENGKEERPRKDHPVGETNRAAGANAAHKLFPKIIIDCV
jgi:hypothetical protein